MSLADSFAASPELAHKRPFAVADRITWKGYPGVVVELRPTMLGARRVWWANSYYVIECANGRHLVDFIDAHLTRGGTLQLVGGAS